MDWRDGWPMRRRTRSGWTGVAGQALTEFALIAPIFMLIALLVIDLGRAYYTYEAIANAAREGARYCALYKDSAGTKTRVMNELGSYVDGTVTVSSPYCDTTVTVGNPVTVTVSATFTPITPLIGSLVGDPMTLTATATMMMTK